MHAIDLTACHDVLESVPDGLDSPCQKKAGAYPAVNDNVLP